jgi:hypothetical protein
MTNNNHPLIEKIVTQTFDLEPYTDVCYYSYSGGEFHLELVISVYDTFEAIWSSNPSFRELPVPTVHVFSEDYGSLWWTIPHKLGVNFFESDFTEFNEWLLGLTNVPDFVYNTDALVRLRVNELQERMRGDTDAEHDGRSERVYPEFSPDE